MKKINYIMLPLLLLAVLFTGCAKNEGLSIKICGYSDSLSENPHKLEYNKWSKGDFVDSKAKKNVTVSVENMEMNGTYVESRVRDLEFYKTHEYKDANNKVFSLTEDGKLCSYFVGAGSAEGNTRTYTEAECIDIAKSFVSDVTDVSNLSQYTVTTEFNQTQKLYEVSFIKYVDGFESADHASVRVEETGHIYSFSSTMFGRIPSDAKTDFDLEEIQTKIIARLDTEYSKAKQIYDKVSYDNFRYTLTMDEEGDYMLQCAVDVDCRNHVGEYDTILGERILLIIQ